MGIEPVIGVSGSRADTPVRDGEADRRIAKRVYSTLTGGTVAYTRFIYRGVHVAFEADSGSTMGLRYTYGLATDDVLAIRDAGGNHYYVVQDLLHSVRGLVKRDGTWVLSQRFGPYGAVIARDTNATGPGFGVRYGWTGREYDAETGWYYFRARYFDPAVRRFVQEDPIGYRAGANVYAYTVPCCGPGGYAYTDAGGGYTIAGLVSGTYTVYAYAPGYVLTYYTTTGGTTATARFERHCLNSSNTMRAA